MSRTEITIGSRRLTLSNLDKVLYPACGFSKAQVIDYYVRIAPQMLPHLQGRPLSLKRYPEGVDGFFFFEKRCPSHRPDWIGTSHIEVKSGSIDFCRAEDAAALAWLGNLACLEIHTYLFRDSAPHIPTMLVFDLDPGAPAGLYECCQVALELRDLLTSLGLASWVKTSGSKGLHLCIPLNDGTTTFEQTKAWSRAAAHALAQRFPERITAIMAKAERGGRVFIDWSQNDFSKTTCCVYSLRAQERPRVSAPLRWSEVERATRSSVDALLRDAPAVLASVQREGDQFAPLHDLVQSLPCDNPMVSDLGPRLPASAKSGSAAKLGAPSRGRTVSKPAARTSRKPRRKGLSMPKG